MEPVGVGGHLPAGTNLSPSPCPLTSPPGSTGCTGFLAQSPLATTIHEGETRPGQQRKFPEATPRLNGRGRPSTLQGGLLGQLPTPHTSPSSGCLPCCQEHQSQTRLQKAPRPRPGPPSEMGLSWGGAAQPASRRSKGTQAPIGGLGAPGPWQAPLSASSFLLNYNESSFK